MNQREQYQRALREILAVPLPERRKRVNPRVIKRKMSNWPVKRPQHRTQPKPTQADEQIALV